MVKMDKQTKVSYAINEFVAEKIRWGWERNQMKVEEANAIGAILFDDGDYTLAGELNDGNVKQAMIDWLRQRGWEIKDGIFYFNVETMVELRETIEAMVSEYDDYGLSDKTKARSGLKWWAKFGMENCDDWDFTFGLLSDMWEIISEEVCGWVESNIS